MFGLRGGVMIDQHELALEISPMTFDYYRAKGTSFETPGSTFQAMFSYGYLATLHETDTFAVYWPFRFGLGFFTGNTYDNVYGQVRADLLGIALRFGHIIVELHLPSIRFATTTFDRTARSGVYLDDRYVYFDTGFTLSYVF